MKAHKLKCSKRFAAFPTNEIIYNLHSRERDESGEESKENALSRLGLPSMLAASSWHFPHARLKRFTIPALDQTSGNLQMQMCVRLK